MYYLLFQLYSPHFLFAVYDKEGDDKYFDIWITDPTASSSTCITCNNSFLLPRSHTTPAWHPNGQYLKVKKIILKMIYFDLGYVYNFPERKFS
jgi:hypothetical protein